MRACLAGLRDEELDAPSGDCTLWRVIAHGSYHGMQHRGEAAMLLTARGHSPGDLDLVSWLMARAG